MIGSIGDIQHQIGVGEDSQTEFKEVILGKEGVLSPDIESIAGEMVAFANAQGGTILLGVNDDGVAVGLPHDRLRILKTGSSMLLPTIALHLYVLICEDNFFLLPMTQKYSSFLLRSAADYLCMLPKADGTMNVWDLVNKSLLDRY